VVCIAAASLLVALVPSPNFRQVYRAPRGIGISHPNRDLLLGAEAALVQHQIYALLLGLLKQAKHYIDLATHGTAKLAAYFALLTYFAHTRTEKLMVTLIDVLHVDICYSNIYNLN
jgi:ubiquitin carboxyl-terminal hydrolase 34